MEVLYKLPTKIIKKNVGQSFVNSRPFGKNFSKNIKIYLSLIFSGNWNFQNNNFRIFGSLSPEIPKFLFI